MFLSADAHTFRTPGQESIAITKNILPVPPMLIDLVGSALTAMDGMKFTDLAACPSCGGPVTGHDLRAKRFAVMLVDGEERTIDRKSTRLNSSH